MAEDYNNLNDEEESGDGTNDNGLEPDIIEEDFKPDRPSTASRKEAFLKLFPLCRLIVRTTCKEMRLNYTTFYRWYDEDKEFAKAVDKARAHVNLHVRDLLMKKVEEGETRAITYFLDRKDPEYRPTSKTEVVTGSRTLEDILKEDDNNANIAEGIHNEERTIDTGSEIPVGTPVLNQGQETEPRKDEVQQSTRVLLEKENTPQPHSESKTKGNIQSDRRRPIARLHTERY